MHVLRVGSGVCGEYAPFSPFSTLDAGRRPETKGLSTLIRSPSATWLILPVVICSAQRLSHACLSIRA